MTKRTSGSNQARSPLPMLPDVPAFATTGVWLAEAKMLSQSLRRSVILVGSLESTILAVGASRRHSEEFDE